MKRVSALLIAGVFAIGLIGCSDKSSATKETKVSTPGGTTTTTEKVEVEKTGDNPPPAAKP
jgi:hypothetical protein